ncbi:MAG TPA: hypothetical protein VHC90_09320 [Bryobacteraceae bacterium]|nr:hypothetical protein [Bryobacteraceae bacterium]
MRRAICLAALLMTPYARAQQDVAPTGEQTGPAAGATLGDYNITQSWELGYRFAEIGGNEGTYRSDVNYRNGIRLLSSSFSVHSLDGRSKWFDDLELKTGGLGNDPYQFATFRIRRNRIYQYDMLWRSNDYFNPGLTVASGNHLEDTTHRWQDHDLTLFPLSAFRLRAGYGHMTDSGPALTTEQEFNTQGDVFPIFRDTRRTYNEYRLGFDANFLRAFRLTVQRRWEYFKEDSGGSVVVPESGATGAVLQNFASGAPYRGRTPSWMGNLNGEFRWVAINARASYSGGRGDFIQNELATGTDRFGNAQNLQVAVTGDGDRPVLTGDFNLTLFPTTPLTIISNTSAANVRTLGDNAFTQITNGNPVVLGQIDFQFLGIRLITNSTDVRYRFSKKFDIFAGSRYADRLIRSTEAATNGAGVLQSLRAEQSNHLVAGAAGINWTPAAALRVHLEGEAGTNSTPFAPVSLRNYHSVRGRTQYRHKSVTLGTGYLENYNNNSIEITSYSSHARSYSADASWTPKSRMSFDASWSKLHLDSIGGIAFFAGSPFAALITGMNSIYISNIHSLNLGIRFTPAKRADLYLGYNLTKDTGDGRAGLATQATPAAQVFYNVQTFPLTYQAPLARLSIQLHEKLRWNAGYQYYGYHEQFGVLSQNQNYRANTGYTSLLWSF